HPYYTVKDAFFLCCFLILYAYLVFFAPDFLGDPINYVPANPIQTPEDIVPEWYFLPFYAILRSIPNKLIGVIALFLSLFTLFFVSWLDTSPVRSARFRPLYKQFFWVLVAAVIILGYVGARPVDATLFNTSIPLVWLGRIFTLYYFLHFWVIMPVAGIIETPRPVPDSIARSVLASTPAE
ncbi:MAG: cytochrome b, partial [Alphaproteobacteria bacterium]|nr:cytochrome b [Alphaproteobacteria bacterium]